MAKETTQDLLAQEIDMAIEEMEDDPVAKDEGSEATDDQEQEEEGKAQDEGEMDANEGDAADHSERDSERDSEHESRSESGEESDESGSEVGDSAPEEKEEKEEEPAPLDQGLLARAVGIGLSLTEAKSFSTSGELGQFIEGVERQFASGNQPADTEVAKESKPDDPFADMPKLDPEIHDAATIEMFDKLTGIVKGQREELLAFQASQESAVGAASAAVGREIEEFFDGQVTKLGKDFEESLGKGGYASLIRGSSQFVKREAIADQMAVMLSGYQAQGRQSPPREEVFDAAARLVLYDEYKALHEKQLSGDLERRATQHIRRVGGKKAASTETPEEEAAAAVDAMLAGR